MPSVKIYGAANSDSSREARRYFKEYDIPVRFTDLTGSTLDPFILSRFISTFTLKGIIDCEGYAYLSLLGSRAIVPESEVLSAIATTPSLLLLPLVVAGSRLAIGYDEDRWLSIVAGISSKG